MAFSKPSNELRGNQRAVGVFKSRSDASSSLTELRDAGFNMNKVSVIAKDGDRYGDIAGAQTQEHVGNKADDGAAKGAVTGSVLGGITGLLVGLGSLAIPGVGPILLAGEVATTLATAAFGAGIGAAAGSLLGGLLGLGIPEERARVYSDRVSSGDYLVIVDGTDEDIRRAENILTNRGIQEFGIYNAPDVANNRTDFVEPLTDAPGTVNNDQIIVVDRRSSTI